MQRTLELLTPTGIVVAVSGTYHSASSGARDSLDGVRGAGAQLTPDEPAEFEIESVEDGYGKPVSLNEKELEALAVQAIAHIECEHSEEDYYGEPDDYCGCTPY